MGLPTVLPISGLWARAGLRTGQRAGPQAPFLALASRAALTPSGSVEGLDRSEAWVWH